MVHGLLLGFECLLLALALKLGLLFEQPLVFHKDNLLQKNSLVRIIYAVDGLVVLWELAESISVHI